jgi:hypothetical protein
VGAANQLEAQAGEYEFHSEWNVRLWRGLVNLGLRWLLGSQ